VEAFPAVPGPRNNLAIALYRSGDHAGAQEQLTRVLEMDPKNFSALFNTGAIYAQETNAPAAIPWLRQAMQQMPLHQFRTYLNDTDLTPIRETPEFLEFLEELDPAFPGAPPPP
jgi:tetratricopeptide (TPR) repeat protein